MTAREARSELPRARVNPANLKAGQRYAYGPRSLAQSGVFVRYEIDRLLGVPIAIFRDSHPLIADWTCDTEVSVGVSGLINTSIEEIA